MPEANNRREPMSKWIPRGFDYLSLGTDFSESASKMTSMPVNYPDFEFLHSLPTLRARLKL
jgi:hypothetical protein